jgi:hypothetical protein
MIALTFTGMIWLATVVATICVIGAMVAGILENASYKRKYKKWLKEADDDLL